MAAEWATYAAAVTLFTWPGLVRARGEIIGAGDDARYYAWLGWRIGRELARGNVLPRHLGDAIHPFGFDLALVDGYLPSWVAGLYNVAAGPFLALNLAIATGIVCDLLAARALARRVSTSRVVHVITAVAFVTAPPVALQVQMAQLPLAWSFTVPLLVADALDVATGTRAVRPARLAALGLVAYLCSVYFLVFGGLAYGVIVAVAAARTRDPRPVLRAAAAAGAMLVALSPFAVARLRFDRDEAGRGAPTALVADSRIFSADLLSIAAQPTRSTFLAPRPEILDRSLMRLFHPSLALEQTLYPGLVLLVGFGAFLAGRDRRRIPVAVAAAVVGLLALGPSLKVGGRFVWSSGDTPVSFLPHRLLLALPGLGALRVPVRAALVLTALCAAATAIALHRMVTRPGARAGLVTSACAALLATNLLVPLPTTDMLTTAASDRALRAIAREAGDGDTVLRVPSDCDPAFVSYQMLHRAPVVGCAGSFAANPWSDLRAYTRSDALRKLQCDRGRYGRIVTRADPLSPFAAADVVELRRRFGVRFLVVDRSLLTFCGEVEAALAFLARYRSLGGDNRFEVLDLAAAAPAAP